MMKATDRNREFIADLAPKRARLCKAQVMRVRGCSATHQTRLEGHEPAVLLVAQSNGLCRKASAPGAGIFAGDQGGDLAIGPRIARLYEILRHEVVRWCAVPDVAGSQRFV